MSSVINTNFAALYAQGALRSNQSRLAMTMERLSTGVRVNSAKDDAAGLAIGQNMASQIRGLDQAVRNINDGINLVQTADGGLSSIAQMLQRMRELAVQSANGTYSEGNRAALNLESAALQADISQVVSSTTFNEFTLLDGSYTNKLMQIGSDHGQTMSVTFPSARLIDVGASNTSVAQIAQISLSTPTNPSPLMRQTAQFIEFTDLGTSGETITLTKLQSPNAANNAITVVGTLVYRGNGSIAMPIGCVDSQLDGTGGKSLRINLQQQFTNGSFDNGVAGSSSIQGWTALNQRVRLDGTSAVAGWPTPTDPTTAPRGGIESASGSGAFNTELSTEASSGAGLSVRLSSSLSGVTNNPSGVGGVLHGPVLSSDTSISLNQGDTISFDWKALGGSDAFDVYAYILDIQTGHTEELLNATGASAADVRQWATVLHTVTSAGDYKFVFVSGSWDATGGQAAGAQLFIDNVTANSSVLPVLTSSQLSGLAGLVSYQNATPITASITINGVSASSGPSATIAACATNLQVAIQNLVSVGSIQDIAVSRVGNDITLTSSSPGTPFSVVRTSPSSSSVLAMTLEDTTPTVPAIDISSQTLAESALSAIDVAINAVSTSRATMGSYLNALAYIGDNVSNIAQNTTASRSKIMDTDYALETTELAKRQIIQQAATAMLAQANQQPQSILELLKTV